MGNTLTGKSFRAQYPNVFPCNQLEETSYSELSSLSGCIKSIKGQKSNSESPTDIYILTDNKDNTLFMKTFITAMNSNFSNNIKSNFEKEIYPIIYEYGVYLGKINKLVNYNICPFFVLTKGGKLHNSTDDILNFLNGKIYNMYGKISDYKTIQNNFIRNVKTIMYNMFFKTPKIQRMSISDDYFYPFGNILDTTQIDENYKFGYFITEGFNNSKTSYDIFANYILKIKTFNNLQFDNFKQLLLLFVFQMANAFKSLELSKIANCDIHLGNILFDTDLQISNLSNNYLTNVVNNNVFFIENNNYKINLPFLIKVYDFDRSYIYGDNTSSYEIKNKHFSIDPTYNKSTVRDFLHPITSIIIYLYQHLEKSVNLSNLEKDKISDILNTLSNIFLKNSNLITIKKTNIIKNTIDNIVPNLTLKNDIDLNNNFSQLNIYSKSLVLFLKQISKTTFTYQDPSIRNKELNDETFSNSIFSNFDEIIELVYKNIDNRFKNISCSKVDCVADINVTKYYLNKKCFDKGGVLDKKELYKIVNNEYTIYLGNKNKKLDTDSKTELLMMEKKLQTESLVQTEYMKQKMKKEYNELLEEYKNK